MTTKKQMIDLLKIEFPTLQVGDEDNGYTELSVEDYEATITEWANVRLVKEAQALEVEAKAEAKLALLEKLGITEDEAKLLA
jgi:hypothetical protein